MRTLMFLLTLALAAPALARPPRVIILPPADDLVAAVAAVDVRALPRCDGYTIPCTARARRGRASLSRLDFGPYCALAARRPDARPL